MQKDTYIHSMGSVLYMYVIFFLSNIEQGKPYKTIDFQKSYKLHWYLLDWTSMTLLDTIKPFTLQKLTIKIHISAATLIPHSRK